MENQLNERVARVEVITQGNKELIEKHDERIEKLEDDNKLLHRLTVNQEVLTALVKESQEVHKETRKTLNEINQNLNQLNQSQEDLRRSHDELKTDINRIDSKVEKVEKVQEEEKEKSSLDLSGLPKKILLWALGVGLTALSTWIYIKFGLK